MPSDINKPAQPRIFQINISNGGVPKRAVRTAHLTTLGVEGDHHRDLKHHGGTERAVCLFSLECIQALQEEGHPIFPGSAGENITIRGLDWAEIKPGKQLRLGDQAILEVTRYTEPCNNIRESFAGGQFIRIAQDRYPGWSRVYARILRVGEIKTGDQVSIVEAGS